MKDLKPLLREGASDFERQLLSAAMRERPSPQLHSRMRRTLGLTGPIAWAGSVKAMLATVAGKGAVAVAVVGLAAGVVGLRAQQAERSAPSANVAVEAPSTAPAAPIPAAVPPSLAVAPAAAPAAPAAVEPAAEEPSSGELREEIRLLDEARSALQRGSGAAALEQLDRYRQHFPSGVLRREASLLRQQAVAGRSAGAAR